MLCGPGIAFGFCWCRFDEFAVVEKVECCIVVAFWATLDTVDDSQCLWQSFMLSD
jgi:hypothetical protein